MRNPSKIHQIGSQNTPSWVQNPLKSIPRGLLEGSWRPLGASLARRPPQEPKSSPTDPRRTPDGPPWTSHFGGPNRPKSILNRTWKPIGYRAPKKIPKVIQNPSKIDPKSIQNRSKIDHFFDHVLRLLLDFVLALD